MIETDTASGTLTNRHKRTQRWDDAVDKAQAAVTAAIDTLIDTRDPDGWLSYGAHENSDGDVAGAYLATADGVTILAEVDNVDRSIDVRQVDTEDETICLMSFKAVPTAVIAAAVAALVLEAPAG